MSDRSRRLHRVRTTPRDDHTRRENRGTQPFRTHRVFDNPDVVPIGWYPLLPSAKLAVGEATSVVIARQRLAVWRGRSGAVHATDAFCAHMGADLGNGHVRGEDLECYFHQWRYGSDGALRGVACGDTPKGVSVRAWPCREAYGFVWAWAGDTLAHDIPRPPGLEGHDVHARHLGTVRLFAHHHVMMAGGIDVQHFASVHGLSADFDVEIEEHDDHTADWRMRGRIPAAGWRGRAGRALLGEHFSYDARIAGGSIVTLTYGPRARLRGTGRPLPPAHILWGCVPRTDGVSDVSIFLLTKKRKGIRGRITNHAALAATAGLLGVLRDDDVLAFPHMRFQIGRLMELDHSVARLVRFIERLPISEWSGISGTSPGPQSTGNRGVAT